MFTCQHGPDECRSDLIGLCVLDLLGGINKPEAVKSAFPFFICMEKASGASTSAPGCFASSLADSVSFTYDDDVLAGCADDDDKSIAVQTLGAAATPAEHQYVPWVVVEGNVIDNPDPLLEVSLQCWGLLQLLTAHGPRYS